MALKPGQVVDLNVVVRGCFRPGIHLHAGPSGRRVVAGYCTAPAVVVARLVNGERHADVLLLPASSAPPGWAHEDVVEGNGLWR